MNFKRLASSQAGFTLIEIMAVLVIIGVITSVAIKKYDFLTDTAGQQALTYAVRELNSRELLTWALVKMSNAGWEDDNKLFAQVNTNVGEGFSWSSPPGPSGGTLTIQTASLSLKRNPSTLSVSGKWAVN
jgi:prepilin-type N-terminal cleavage/methylation domain-containing protein